MTNLVQSLFRIDPTEGLVQYASAVKPYHSKILDVLVEYVYGENINVSMKERWSWTMTFDRPKTDIVYTCGYGLVWDPYRTAEAAPPVNIVKSQAAFSLPITIRSTADNTIVSISSAGYTMTDGMTVVLTSTGSYPTTSPQIAAGVPYVAMGHNASFRLIDPTTNSPIHFTEATISELRMSPSELAFNSFLVEPNYGPSYNMAVINAKANQFAFVDTFNITQVEPSSNRWTIGADIRPTFTFVDIVYDDATLPNPAVANNCCFVVSGNVESYFPPGSQFTVIGGPNAGTFVVSSASSRLYTRYDGNQTIIPVNQVIIGTDTTGTARTGLDTILPVGAAFYINNNTGVGGNGRYVVSSVSVVGSVTKVVVEETVSMLAASNGTANITVSPTRVPAWPAGLQIAVTSTGAYPPPLSAGAVYSYAPTKTPGVFNLARKRYPTEFDDYVNITTLNSGAMSVRRAEVFNPGAYVKVSGTYMNRNDGNYIIRKIEKEGVNYRVHVMEKIPYTTPQDRPFDGLMEFNFDSYDAPVYCPVSSAPDLHADTFIHEKIVFEYGFHLTDTIRARITDVRFAGFGSAPYGSEHTNYGAGSITGARAYTSPAAGTLADPAGTMLPHGIDVQLFGVGGIDEDVWSAARNYGKVV